MKQCLRCNRTYSDNDLNFCLDDGEMLVAYPVEPQLSRPPQPPTFTDDAPPTVMLDSTRVTNPTNWPDPPPQSSPPAPWQAQAVNAPPGQFMPRSMSPNQTLAITSLGLGVASVTVGWCCSTGLLLSPAALVTGFIALSQIKKDPASYGGRGFAIGGIVTGIVYISVLLLIVVIYGIAIIGGGLGSMH